MIKFMLMMLFSFNSFAVERSITCDLSHLKGVNGIETLEITTGNPGSVKVEYDDQSTDLLFPVKSRGGLFDDIKFPGYIDEISSQAFSKIKLDTTHSRIDSLFISFKCHNPASRACQGWIGRSSRGAISSDVILNLNGKIVKFLGSRLTRCKRI